MDFEILGDVTGVETIATGRAYGSVRDYGSDKGMDGGGNARDLRRFGLGIVNSFGRSSTGTK
jgi:hypothetical protein